MKKSIKLALVVSVFCTFANAQMSEMEFKCKEEKNPYACVKLKLDKLEKERSDDVDKLSSQNLTKNQIMSKRLELSNDVNDKLEDLSEYCFGGSSILSFFSKKKSNSLNGKACAKLNNYIVRMMFQPLPPKNQREELGISEKNLDKINDLREDASKLFAKTVKAGCEHGDYESCKYTFLLYHPFYNSSRYIDNDTNIAKVAKKYVKGDLETSVKAYQRACKLESRRNFCKVHKDYLENNEE